LDETGEHKVRCWLAEEEEYVSRENKEVLV
jgi:hypothetical protein